MLSRVFSFRGLSPYNFQHTAFPGRTHALIHVCVFGKKGPWNVDCVFFISYCLSFLQLSQTVSKEGPMFAWLVSSLQALASVSNRDHTYGVVGLGLFMGVHGPTKAHLGFAQL